MKIRVELEVDDAEAIIVTEFIEKCSLVAEVVNELLLQRSGAYTGDTGVPAPEAPVDIADQCQGTSVAGAYYGEE